MAIIVEDGTGIANANSYVTFAEVQTYATLRGKGSLFPTDNADAQSKIIIAADYLQLITDFSGTPTDPAQSMLWPRSGVYIDGVAFPDDEIPQQLKTAQIQLAMAVASGVDLLPYPAQNQAYIKREKVGPIETEYFEGASVGMVFLPTVDAILEGLRGGGTAYGFKTVRV